MILMIDEFDDDIEWYTVANKNAQTLLISNQLQDKLLDLMAVE